MATKPPQRIGPFPLGMDNRAPDFSLALPENAGHLLRDALNVDVTPRGSLKTRKGQTLAQDGTDCHSAWAPIGGAYGLFCDAGTIYRMDVAANGTITRTAVAQGFGFSTPVRYAQVNEAVYFTDSLRGGSYHPRPGPTPAWADAVGGTVGERVLAPMPPGSCIAHGAGRLLVAVGALLIYSEPFDPSRRSVSAGYELLPEPITCVVHVDGGTFVTTASATYFAAGGFPAQTLREVLAYGAPEQQPGYRQDGGAHWMSAEGIVSCNRMGELANLQDEHIAMSVTGAAATLWREADGMQSIVAALSSPSDVGAGVGTYMQARLVKKETP
jgi:hypothetical protein